MNGLSQKHQPKSQDFHENIDPQRIAKSLVAGNTDEGTAEVTAEQSTRLRRRRAR
jgi:hypothetical protein